MLTPSKDTFFYFLHPEFLKSDTKKYEEMEKDADKTEEFDEIDSFHIGYGHFFCSELFRQKFRNSSISFPQLPAFLSCNFFPSQSFKNWS